MTVYKTDGQQTIEAVVMLLGSQADAARAMRVNKSTVTRWLNGVRPLNGTALVAARAIIKHPDEYRRSR